MIQFRYPVPVRDPCGPRLPVQNETCWSQRVAALPQARPSASFAAPGELVGLKLNEVQPGSDALTCIAVGVPSHGMGVRGLLVSPRADTLANQRINPNPYLRRVRAFVRDFPARWGGVAFQGQEDDRISRKGVPPRKAGFGFRQPGMPCGAMSLSSGGDRRVPSRAVRRRWYGNE